METLRIYEVDYSVSPGGINMFEVYPDVNSSDDTSGFPLFESTNLIDACLFCYNQGVNFTVYTLAQYYMEEFLDTPARS